jgi:hypothetical protein
MSPRVWIASWPRSGNTLVRLGLLDDAPAPAAISETAFVKTHELPADADVGGREPSDRAAD